MDAASKGSCGRSVDTVPVQAESDLQKHNQQERAPRTAKLVVVAPGGDVLFEVGKGDYALYIRISGAVVSLASEVFARMLSSSFIEGQTKVVSLPEDDPRVMLAFCNIAHHKTEDLDHLTPEDLLKLATFADMRLCTTVLRPWVHMRISRFIDAVSRQEGAYWRMDDDTYDAENKFEFQKMLPIITLFGMDRPFYKYSRIMISSIRIVSTRDEGSVRVHSEVHPRVVEVQDAIAKAGEVQVEKFFRAIMECIGKSYGEEGDLSCQWHKYGFMMHQMRVEGVDPSRNDRTGLSVQVIACRVVAIVDKLQNNQSYRNMLQGSGCSRRNRSACNYCTRDFANDLDRMRRQELREEVRDLQSSKARERHT